MEQALTIREWYDEHENVHEGRDCAGKPFVAFLANWAEGTAYIDDRFLFEEVGGTLMLVHHTREEWIQMGAAMNILAQTGIPVLPENVILVDEETFEDSVEFTTSVRNTIDELGSER